MVTSIRLLFVLFLVNCCLNVSGQPEIRIQTVPGYRQQTHIDINGTTVLPSGRYITPAGQSIRITHSPFGMSISPDGARTVVLHNGVITVIQNQTLSSVRIPAYDSSVSSPFSNGSFLGVAFAADSRTVYLSGGDNGAVLEYDIEKFQRLDSFSLNGTVNGVQYDDSFTSDILYNNDKNELLVLDRGNFRMVRIDLSKKKITASVKTGRQPFGLTLSPDHHFAFVANVGMYDYPLMPGLKENSGHNFLLPFQPYGNNTYQSVNGYTWKGRKIPGVGSPDSREAMSVYAIDLNNNSISDKYKTGYQVGEIIEGVEVVGGASPNSLVAGHKYLYVTNATNDNISVIDYHLHKITGQIAIKVDSAIDRYRGLLPFGIDMSRDEKTLYVALLGFNAIAVVDAEKKITKGLIPTGWGPTRIKLGVDEKEMFVTCCRGFGAGPNGGNGFIKPVQGTYIGDIQLGSFQKIPMPDFRQLFNYTKNVIDNTFMNVSMKNDKKNPLPLLPGKNKSSVKYIVYITKENRTYDEVLGQLASGNGDITIARFGTGVNINEGGINLQHVDIAPNHLKLARTFTFSDNFYCDGDASVHGHHWMMGVIPNEWVEANSSVNKTAKIFSKASGRRFPGTLGSMDPEDYAERGGLWEALERSKISFYNFGEANETAHVREEWYDTITGAAHPVMVPMPKALYTRTSHDYAGFNTNIPDQFRMDQFERAFTKMWLEGKSKMPHLITVQIPNDHTADTRPEDGYPFRHSFVADNDLALGRILHFLSRTPYWKNMLVIITEDDAQGGVDHIDAHRSLLMMAGPYVKRGYVSHTHANFGSILKVIYNILGVPYVNQYDATASLLNDVFTSVPDYSPYTMEFPSLSVFDPGQAMKRYNKTINWRKIKKAPDMDDENDARNEHYKVKH